MSFVTKNTTNGYTWSVHLRSGQLIAFGNAATRDQAKRNARSFIRNNQNLVYGG